MTDASYDMRGLRPDCIVCPASLLCVSGSARFYFQTMKAVYVYLGEFATVENGCILLSEEQHARCWKAQSVINGRGVVNGEISASGDVRRVR